MSYRYYKSSSDWDASTVIAFIIMGIFLLYVLWSCGHDFNYETSEEHTYTAYVTNMDVKTKDRESKYLVFTRLVDTDEVRVFQITDSYSHGRFNSSDLYGSIEVGKTYVFTVYGYRTEYLSEYENILSVEEVSSLSESDQLSTEEDTQNLPKKNQ